jgi:Serine acetyltransferase
MTPAERAERKERKRKLRELHARHPKFFDAVAQDAYVTSCHRGEYFDPNKASMLQYASRALRLMWSSDAFFAHVCYRARMRLRSLGVPVLPRLLHKISMITSQLSIGDPVVMAPGVYIAHGQTVIDGLVEIGHGCVIAPWTSIGLVSGNLQGPRIGERVFVGTGARVLGDFEVGDDVVIAAQAMVTTDVPSGVIVGGIPAKVIGNA